MHLLTNFIWNEELKKRKMEIEQRLTDVRSRIQRAAKDSSRNVEDINLICVTKYYPWEDAYILHSLGQRDLAENRVQELQEKMEKLQEIEDDVRWHLIGTLQRNKVKYIIGKVAMIHSVDSLRLAREIDKQASKSQTQEKILLQVNITQEESKHGYDVSTLKEEWDEIQSLSSITVCGLMTMAEFGASPDRLEQTFLKTRDLRDSLRSTLSEKKAEEFIELSMGMSQDYEIAVRCGATQIRLGSTILE